MQTIIYKSKAIDSFTREEIIRMLNRSKRRNKKHGVTGCIFYHNNHFIQLIEGEENEIHQLYDNIKEDDRHSQVELLLEKKSNERSMLDWSMAYYDLSGKLAEQGHRRLLLESLFVENLTNSNQDVVEFLKSEITKLIG